ncbi:nucleotidyltransferase domain-containing protein [Cyanobacterium aponinum FACHB-4101]|uniref:nucleotidyltransferase family protein n=1 Tax=Cyanobacterium aponinum TaxID=379064 RepID=UPI00168116FE|nr:nucleotidyltransferase domain-containing protein [Cyanobacterium aponinum]MBD2394969.1 nucleotidyltransferase domain-containing protein [Cyanobacterium aponinum FACHB-4101]
MFDYTAARNYQRQKQEKLKAERFNLWQQAKQDCEKIIQTIIEKYQPKRIIQWGSLLESKHFSEASDIDLAVEGIESITFFKMLGDVEDLTDFSVDLIRWENLDSSFQKIILMKGKIIYEQR